MNGVLRFVDPRTGAELASVSNHDLRIASNLAFSANQRWLVTAPADEQSPTQVWDLMTLRRELEERHLDWPPDVLCATPSPLEVEEQVEVVFDDLSPFEPPAGQSTSP